MHTVQYVWNLWHYVIYALKVLAFFKKLIFKIYGILQEWTSVFQKSNKLLLIIFCSRFQSNHLHLQSFFKIGPSKPCEWKAKLSLPFHHKALLHCYCAFYVNKSKLFVAHQPRLTLYIHHRTLLLFSACEALQHVSLILQNSLYVCLCVCASVLRCMRIHVLVCVFGLSRVSVLCTVAQTVVDSLQNILTFGFSKNNTWCS